MDEMITYCNQEVDKMDIDRKYKMAILGMIVAIGYENKKQESSAGHEPERKTGRWIIHKSPDRYHANNMECSECGFKDIEDDEYNYCPNCGAKIVQTVG